MEAPYIDWKNQENVLLLNPRWPEDVNTFFQDQFKLLKKNQDIQGCVFLPTSGTSAKNLRETKIVVLSKQAILNSAESVGTYFKFSSDDRVAVTLPFFHVGGLSQLARSFIWQQQMFLYEGKWQALRFHDFLLTRRVTHTSLVPTQVYDLVQMKLKAPAHVKCVFVGGGMLGNELKKRAQDLGWNLIVTYGSTETSSMVAVQERQAYQTLPHSQWRISSQNFLEIKSNSLLSYYWCCGADQSYLENPLVDGWLTTSDLAQEVQGEFEILGRGSDYAKVNGEGVYLSRLQLILQDCLLEMSLCYEAVLGFVLSERSGQEVHIFSTTSDSELKAVISRFNEKVLPFERIQGFHHVDQIPRTDLGKVRWQELK